MATIARTTRLALTLAVLLAAATAATAAAQDSRLGARLDSVTRSEVERLADSARAAGLPDEPLIQKALEGASKRAPSPRIVAAVAHVLESLRSARTVLGPRATADELVAGAASLRAGAAPAMLHELQQLGPRDGIAVPLAVLTDLVMSGVTVDAAWRSVERLAQRGARDTEFLELRDRIGREATDYPHSQGSARPSLRFVAEGAWGQTEPLGQGPIGTVAASVVPAVIRTDFGRIEPEIAGSASASAHDRAYDSRSWDAMARLHATGRRGGIWAGFGFGYGAAHTSAQTARRIDIGGWTRVGPTTVRVWLAQAAFDDSLRVSGPASTPVVSPSQDTLPPQTTGSGTLGVPGGHGSTLFLTGYTDLGSRLSFPVLDRYEVDASLARRFGSDHRATAWRLGGTMWLSDNLAFVAAAGYAAPDLPAALPGGRFTIVGLRLALGAGRPNAAIMPSTSAPSAGNGTSDGTPVAAVELRHGGRFIILAPNAETVEAMGDFTDWQPMALRRVAEGRWELPQAVAAGVHQFNVRLNGGAWIVPAGASAVDDGFGGRTGMVVVRS